jgi:hypothetical protein
MTEEGGSRRPVIGVGIVVAVIVIMLLMTTGPLDFLWEEDESRNEWCTVSIVGVEQTDSSYVVDFTVTDDGRDGIPNDIDYRVQISISGHTSTGEYRDERYTSSVGNLSEVDRRTVGDVEVFTVGVDFEELSPFPWFDPTIAMGVQIWDSVRYYENRNLEDSDWSDGPYGGTISGLPPQLIPEKRPPSIDADLGVDISNSIVSYSVNVSDPDGDDVYILIDFGDGTVSDSPSGEHHYGRFGEYVINMTADDGMLNGTSYQEYVVNITRPLAMGASHAAGEGIVNLTVQVENVADGNVTLVMERFALLDSDDRVIEYPTSEVASLNIAPGETVTFEVSFVVQDDVEPMALLYDYRYEIPLA